MTFYQSQNTARRNSFWLILLFACAITLICCLLYFLAKSFVLNYADLDSFWRKNLEYKIATPTVLVICGGSLFQIIRLSKGGYVVANLLGGQLILPETKNLAERQLLNVVEEISLASGVRMPSIYILEEQGINAFAAGTHPRNAVIGVTRGALESFERDELQAVVAHEFSHIANHDMVLNVRIMGVIFGLFCISLMGEQFFRNPFYTKSGSRRNRNSLSRNFLLLASFGILLIVIGYFGLFLGQLIQAALSRQREYLADASAVQFTRNKNGMASALWKIHQHGSRIRSSAYTREVSHLFFAESAMSLLNSHPPVLKRIQAINPYFLRNKIREESQKHS